MFSSIIFSEWVTTYHCHWNAISIALFAIFVIRRLVWSKRVGDGSDSNEVSDSNVRRKTRLDQRTNEETTDRSSKTSRSSHTHEENESSSPMAAGAVEKATGCREESNTVDNAIIPNGDTISTFKKDNCEQDSNDQAPLKVKRLPLKHYFSKKKRRAHKAEKKRRKKLHRTSVLNNDSIEVNATDKIQYSSDIEIIATIDSNSSCENDAVSSASERCRNVDPILDETLDGDTSSSTEYCNLSGKYRLVHNHNFDVFLKAIGVPMLLCKAACASRPIHTITHNGNTLRIQIDGITKGDTTFIINGPSTQSSVRHMTSNDHVTYVQNGAAVEVRKVGINPPPNGPTVVIVTRNISDDGHALFVSSRALFKDGTESLESIQTFNRIS